MCDCRPYNELICSLDKSVGKGMRIANTKAISSYSSLAASASGNSNGVSFETCAAALILGLFAIFIVVYTVCLQCCWNNRRCPWFLGKDNAVETPAKDKYTFCPCVQAIQSPDS